MQSPADLQAKNMAALTEGLRRGEVPFVEDHWAFDGKFFSCTAIPQWSRYSFSASVTAEDGQSSMGPFSTGTEVFQGLLTAYCEWWRTNNARFVYVCVGL
jgi:hypothetical protein